MMMKTLRKSLIACLAFACMLTAVLGGVFFVGASAAEGDVPSATTVPEEELEQLSIENGTIAYATGTGTATLRFTPAGADGDYTLANATDLAFRFKVMNRQANRPNVGSGLCYVRVKFAGNDTVFGVTKEDMRFTFVDAETGSVGNVRFSNGGDNAVGGQLNVGVGKDGTVYVPLTQFRDGDSTSELGNRLTDTENYQNLSVEYIEFSYSAHRWDFAFGDIAMIRQSDGAVTTDILDLTAAAQTANLKLYDAWYDNVTLIVNGMTAEKNEAGEFEVDLGDAGRVYIPSDKLFAYDPIALKSDLAAGYGITKVSTEVDVDGYVHGQYGEEKDNWNFSGSNAGRNKSRSALLNGYTYEGEYFLRFGNHSNDYKMGDSLEQLGAAPINGTITVEVSPLVALSVTGEQSGVDVYYTRLSDVKSFVNITSINDWSDMPDDGTDGTLWLKPNEESAVVVVPKAGYDFTGLKLNGQALTADTGNIVTDETSGRTTAALYKVAVGETGTLEIMGVGDEVTLGLDVAAEGGSVTVDGTQATGTEFTSNVYKTLVIEAAPEKGYSASVSVVYPAEEDGEEAAVPLTASSDGKYYYQVDKELTLKVTFDVVTYNLTYRLNNGEYASGESNPATITYFDSVTLKIPAREGYDFKGWRIEGQSDYVTELKNVESDLTLIAVFEMSEGTGGEDKPGPEEPADPGKDNTGLIIGLSVGGAVIVVAAIAVAIIVRKKKGQG